MIHTEEKNLENRRGYKLQAASCTAEPLNSKPLTGAVK